MAGSPDAPVLSRRLTSGCPGCDAMASTREEFEGLPRHTCGLCNGKVDYCVECNWRGQNQVGQPCIKCEAAVVGRRCQRYPMRNGPSCPSHAGKSKAAVAKRRYVELAGKASARAGELLEAYTDLDIEIHPMDGLVDAVRRSYAMMQAAGEMAENVDDPTQYGGEAGPKVDAILGFYEQTVANHAKLCKLALDAGIDEARLGLAQNQGERIQAIITLFINSLFHELADAGVPPTTLAHFKNVRVGPILRAAFDGTSTQAALPPAV